MCLVMVACLVVFFDANSYAGFWFGFQEKGALGENPKARLLWVPRALFLARGLSACRRWWCLTRATLRDVPCGSL